MRIGVDLRALQLGSEYRGIGAYLRRILERFPFDGGEHEFTFLRLADSDPLEPLGLSAVDHETILIDPVDPDDRRSVWQARFDDAFRSRFGDLADRGLDVFWQPDMLNGVPDIPELPVVLTMYDVIPLVMPEAYLPTFRERIRREGRPPRAALQVFIAKETWHRRYTRCIREARRADAVLSISHATTTDLVRLAGIDADRITTIHLGAPEPGADEADEVAALRDRSFLLFIGGIDHRRRIDHLIGAFDGLRADGHDVDLVLVGRDLENLDRYTDHPGHRALAASPHAAHVHNLGFVTDARRNWLYRNAAAFVFPSVYEGFGLPVLEAMVHDCPVVTYRNSSLPEVGGDAAVYVDEPGAAPLARAIEPLLTDPSSRATIVAAGRARASGFSWDRCAATTFATITDAGVPRYRERS